jgi:hypothetical protein
MEGSSGDGRRWTERVRGGGKRNGEVRKKREKMGDALGHGDGRACVGAQSN